MLKLFSQIILFEKVHYIILSCGQHYVNEMIKKKN